MASLRGELIRRLREQLSEWPDVGGACLFGSVARGDATGGSDVDVLLIAEDLDSAELHELISGLQTKVQVWTGNVLQLVEHSPISWRKLVRTKNPLVTQIRTDGIALHANDSALLERQK